MVFDLFVMKGKTSFSSQEIYELQQRITEYEDESAYKKLFFHYFQPLKSFSFSIVKSNETAEEIVSDIFVELWVKRKQLCAIEDLKMYLYTSVKNNSVRKLNQHKKAGFVPLDDVQVEFASPDENGERILLTRELSCKIDAAIEDLPQRCKMIFKLANEDKLKYKEIATLLNISIKTIDAQIATALKKIGTVLNRPVNKPSAH